MRNIHNITAGAGAGKTTELVNVICGLLSRQENKPERMILTTFTKAAAAEFRERVKERLFATGNKDAAIAVDAAQMGTIDSIAETYISRYWYLLDMSPNLTPISKSESERLMEEALSEVVQEDDIIFFHKYAENFSFIESGIDSGIDYDFWKEQFKEIARMKQEAVLTLNEMNDWGAKSKALLEKAFVPTEDFSDLKRAAEEFLAICEQYEKIDIIPKGSKNKMENQKGVLKNINGDPLSFFKLKEMLTVLKTPFGLNKKAKDDYLGPLQAVFDSLTNAIKAIVPKEASTISECSDRITQIAMKGIEAYETAKRNAGVIDFSDMEAGLLRLLDFDEVRSDISDSVDYLFVDEFQDCNAIQIAIFTKLSDLVKQSWFVGDMKQAIYGFRGSDTELVADFCRNFPEAKEDQLSPSGYKQNGNGLSSQILDISYRSVPGLVDMSNDVFVKAFKTPYVNEECGEKFVYDKETITDEGMVRLEKYREAEGNHPVLFHANLYKETEGSKTLPYSALATFVCSLLNGEYKPLKGLEIKPADIAILTRKNGHVVRIASELQKKNIPTTAVDRNFKKSIEVAVLLDILRLTAGIQTEKTGAELIYMLHSMTFRQSVDSVRDNAERDHYLKGIEAFARSLRGLSMVDRVDAIIARFDLYDFSSRWNSEDQRRENLDLVRQIAREFDQECQVIGKTPDCRSFLSFVTKYSPEPAFNNNTEGVKVLTCHKAKGLEWKVVILWQISGGDDNGKPDIVSGATKDYYIAPVPKAAWAVAAVNNNPVLRKIRLTSLAKSMNEERRLLYVGVTRARDILITAGMNGAEMETIHECCPSAPTDDVFDQDASKARIWDKEIESVLVDVMNNPDALYRKANPTADVPNPSIFPFPSIASPGDEKYRNPSKLEFPDVIVRARAEIVHEMKGRMDIRHPGLEDNEFGDCIHHIYAACRADAPEKSRAITSRTLLNWGVDDISAPEKVTSSYEELCAFLATRYGNAISVGHEVPFVYQDAEGHVYSGVMDMLWETASGVVIVDFKTFGGTKAEALKESVQEHSSQLHEYREALTAAGKKVLATVLHYPVTGVVIEVKN